jgi:hypothetical protein
MIQSARATAYLWEYRFLNRFLVRHTQGVLDWLATRAPMLMHQIDAELIPFIQSSEERNAIIRALSNHHLITVGADGLVEVTPKGHEYREWRGPLPPVARVEDKKEP